MKLWIIAASEDGDLVSRLRQDLHQKGIDSDWSEDAILPGEERIARMAAGIVDAQQVVVVVSTAAVDSPWVSAELAYALSAREKGKTKRIIPVLAEKGVTPPALLLNVAHVDLSTAKRYRDNLPTLILALQSAIRPRDTPAEASLDPFGSKLKMSEFEAANERRMQSVQTLAAMTFGLGLMLCAYLLFAFAIPLLSISHKTGLTASRGLLIVGLGFVSGIILVLLLMLVTRYMRQYLQRSSGRRDMNSSGPPR
jgi:hypothetical protein